jgi:F0F1-type ATP synthase delta subunit
MFSISAQSDKSFGVLLKSLASFEENDKSLESLRVHIITVLEEEFQSVSHQDRVLLIDGDKSDHIDDLWVNFFRLLVSNKMLDDLLEVLLFGLKGKSFQEGQVSLGWDLKSILSEKVTGQEIVLL